MQIIKPAAWKIQPPVPVGVDWSNPITRGLVSLAPLSPQSGLFDIVAGVMGNRTGLGSVVHTRRGTYYNFGTSNYLDFPHRPKNITHTTPSTIAWTQEARSSASYSTILCLNVGGLGVPYLAIYQGVSPAAGYEFVCGPNSATGAHSWSAAMGGVVNNRYDRFVLTAAAGFSSTTATNWNLYWNGVLVTRGTTTIFAGSTADVYRVGALHSGGDPWEGAIGNIHVWNRVLRQDEITEWSNNEFCTLAPVSNKIFISGPASGAYSLTVSTASMTTTGQNIGLAFGRKLTVDTANMTMSGVATGLSVGKKITVDTAAMTTTGVAVNLRIGRNLSVSTASITTTGIASNLIFGRKLGVSVAPMTMAGVNATLTYSPSGGAPYTLPVSVAAMTMTGQPVGLSFGRRLSVATASMTTTGVAAGLKFDRRLTVSTAAVAMTGVSATLTYSGAAATTLTAADIDLIWDEDMGEGYTARQIMTLMSAVLLGKVSGAGTGTEVFKGLDGTTDRVISTVDTNGNRSSVTLNGS